MIKRPEDATTTDEILEMYNKQPKKKIESPPIDESV